MNTIDLSGFEKIEKAYQEGIYSDSPANRKLGRVGMTYKQYSDSSLNKEVEEKKLPGGLAKVNKDIDISVKKEKNRGTSKQDDLKKIQYYAKILNKNGKIGEGKEGIVYDEEKGVVRKEFKNSKNPNIQDYKNLVGKGRTKHLVNVLKVEGKNV